MMSHGPDPTPQRSATELLTFLEYALRHPEQRFWQALRNWSGASYIYLQRAGAPLQDTFYWEQTPHADRGHSGELEERLRRVRAALDLDPDSDHA